MTALNQWSSVTDSMRATISETVVVATLDGPRAQSSAHRGRPRFPLPVDGVGSGGISRGVSWLWIGFWSIAISALSSQSAQAYTVTAVPFQWESLQATNVALEDNSVSAPIPLPFSFKFLYSYPDLLPYGQVSIGSNGFITFLAGEPDGCTGLPGPCGGQLLPSENAPFAVVAGYWGDLDPSAGGTVAYGTIRTAPDRVFIVQFDGVPHARGGPPVSFQIRLYEGSNNIEIHCKSCLSDGGLHTQGIESQAWSAAGAAKTTAVCYTINPALNLNVNGYYCSQLDNQGHLVKSERNAADFSLIRDAVRFTPSNNRSILTPVLPATTTPAAPIVKLRYEFRVEQDETGRGFKLLFGFTNIYNPANYQSGVNRDVYELDSAFYAQGMRYRDPLCYSDFVPPSQLVAYNQDASFRLSIPDYSGKGFTGSKTDHASAFPRATSLGAIDGIASASTLVSQFDITGHNGTYLLSREGLLTDKSGWHYSAAGCDPQGVCSCQDAGLDPNNPAHAFRQWDYTMTFDGASYTTHAALPDDAASAIIPWSPLSLGTEYFFTMGRFRVYLWGLQVSREGSTAWEPLDKWQVATHDGSTRYFGFKLSRYNNQCVIEVGTDPDQLTTYLFGIGGGASTPILDLSSCSATPTVMTGPASSVCANGAVLNGIVNANGAAGTAWFEYGSTQRLGYTSLLSQISGSGDTSISVPLPALIAGTSYYYRLVASTTGGTGTGDAVTFSTGSMICPRQVPTLPIDRRRISRVLPPRTPVP